MRNVVIVSFFMACLALDAQAEMKWSGSSSVRYRVQNFDTGLNTTDATTGKNTSKSTKKAWEFRAQLGASDKGEMVDWGLGLRTQSSATSEWLTVQGNQDLDIGLEQAYLRFHADAWESEWAAILGRAKTVLFYDSNAQVLFDKDVRWDGLAETWKMGNFGVNLTQYVLGARSSGSLGTSTFTKTAGTEANPSQQSGFAALYSIQPHATFDISEDIKALFALSYLHWTGNGDGNDTTAGTYDNKIFGGVTTSGTDVLIMDNARQWHFFTNWSLPWELGFSGEYVRNKEVFYGSRTAMSNVKADIDAYGVTLSWKKVKEAGDYSIAYSYVDKGLGSVVNAYTNGNMPADLTGHLIDAKYALAEGLVIGAKGEFYKEKSQLSATGAGLTGANAGRKQTENRYEFVAGMTF